MRVLFAVSVLMTAFSVNVFAKGNHSGMSGPGTGAKSSSTHVQGHTRHDGTYVSPHQRTTPDHNFNNNFGTKGNTNPYTGKDGSRVHEPERK